MMAGKTLHGQDIQGLMKRMQAGIEPAAQAGTGEKKDLLDQYVSTIAERVKLARPMKIALDCGNGVGGVVAARLFKALGCEVDMLFEDVDGSFPPITTRTRPSRTTCKT